MDRLVGLASALLGCAVLVTAVLRAGELARDPNKSVARPAQTAAADGIPQFSALDVNADTMISAEEAKAHAGLAAIFTECDADKNGMLSTWEFAEARSKLDK